VFLEGKVENLEEPELIPDIQGFKNLFKHSIPKNAVVFGDYDVDGTTSTFMMSKLFKQIGVANVSTFHPDRFKDGYGLNKNSLNTFNEEYKNKKIDIVTLLDCGTNSKEEIVKLKNTYNCKVVVVDHHILDDIVSCVGIADVVVSNRLPNGTKTPYCTGGLMYQISRGMAKDFKQIDPNKYLPYGAIATVADLVDLEYNNRIIVSEGLKQIKNTDERGLIELCHVSNVDLDNATPADIGFGIGPRINANGRIKHAKIVQQLFNCKNLVHISKIVDFIDKTNETRKDIQRKITDEAFDLVGNMTGRDSILIANESWNPGVVGIVASKLQDEYKVPVMVFGGNAGKFKGSARSVEGIDVKGEVMDKISHIFGHYGGHEMAAGAELKKEYLDTAWDIFDEQVKKVKQSRTISGYTILYDATLSLDTFKKINDSFCDKIFKIGPFGKGNESPVFKLENLQIADVHQWKSNSGGFVKINGMNYTVIAFGQGVKEKFQNKTMDVLVQIKESFFDDKKYHIEIIASR